MNPKILIISMNSFSKVNNNGKTIETIFEDYPHDLLSHIYFSLEEEDLDFCKHALRFNTYDALDNSCRLFKRRYGEVLNIENNDIYEFKENKYFDFVQKRFRKSKKNWNAKLPINLEYRNKKLYLFTELIWYQKRWCYKQIQDFILLNQPDIIFYQANLYSFLHKIVTKIAIHNNIPIMVQCTDDYTIPHIKESKMNYLLNKYYMLNFKKLMKYSSSLLAISDKMAKEYSENYFNGKAFVFSNFVERNNSKVDYKNLKDKQLLYAGNLGLNRWKTLVSLGKALDILNKKDLLSGDKCSLSIYSGDKLSEEMKKEFGNIESVIFHGFLKPKELDETIINSDYLIHCESFDEDNKRVTRLSISTKIGEYICSGRCIIAIGPEDVASIEYLKNKNLAKVINSDSVNEILSNLINLFKNDEESILYTSEAEKEKHNRFNKTYLNSILKEMIETAMEDKQRRS